MPKSNETICPWVNHEQVYIDYHNEEWGRPVYDALELFEKLCLDGLQAGLSWITILKKKQGYRDAFCNFDPYKIIELSPEYLDGQLDNSQIIRNKLKINSIVRNAQAYVKFVEQGEDFSQFLWQFVGGKPKVNQFKTMDEVPTQTEQSVAMSKALKKLGFNFVGPTICYAFMQAVGMVNDHLVGCDYYEGNVGSQ
ncbi:DNA-3-methyladenine glycosylase I [Alteromonadales bacterium alter-6D02]|nr:DNA-3-methyladenine glycosylase I [Alteromonadales bacterium alter-6D02]